MKEKAINEAGTGRIGRLVKDVWFVVVSNGRAPVESELKLLCEMNGIAYYDVRKLFAAFRGWEQEGGEG